MKIIGGLYRNRNIESVPSFDTRPMTGRQKKSVFDIIGDEIENIAVLDLFCGSGSLGIEAISRGAKRAVFVDNSYLAVQTVEKTLKKFDYHGDYSIIKNDCVKTVLALSESFQLIFADPPYNKGLVQPITDALTKRIMDDKGRNSPLISGKGAIFLRHTHKELPKIPQGLELFRQVKGQDIISIFRPQWDNKG